MGREGGDSSSIYWPLSLANLDYAPLWMVYGMVGILWDTGVTTTAAMAAVMAQPSSHFQPTAPAGPCHLSHAHPSAFAFSFLQAKRDWFFIAMPNAMGVAFNTASLILCVILPARDRQAKDSSSVEAASEVSDSHEIDLAVEAVSQHAHTK